MHSTALDGDAVRGKACIAICRRAVCRFRDLCGTRDLDGVVRRRTGARSSAVTRQICTVDLVRGAAADLDMVIVDQLNMCVGGAARAEELTEYTVDGGLNVTLGDCDRVLLSFAVHAVIAANRAALDLSMHNGIDRGTRGICSAVNRNTVRADGGCTVAACDAVDRSLVDGDAVVRDRPRAAVGNAIARGQIVRFAAEDIARHRTIRDCDLIVIDQSRPRCNTAKEVLDRAGVQRQLVPHGIRTRGGVAAVARNESRRVVEYEGIVLDDLFIAGLTTEVFPDGIASIDRIPSAECARMRMVRVLVTMELCVNVVARRRGCRIRLCAQLDAVLVVAAPIRRTGRCIVGKSQIRCAIGRCVAVSHQRDRADIAEVVLHALSLFIEALAAPPCRVEFDVLPRNRAPECVVVMGEREHGVARCNTRVQMEFVRVEVLRGVCRNALGLHNQVVVPNGIEAAARNARGVAASVEGRIAEVRCGTPVHIAKDNAVARRSTCRILSIAAVDLARDRAICYRNCVVDGRGLAHATRNRNAIRCGPGVGPCSQRTAREFHPAVRHAARRRAHTNDSTFDNAVIHLDRVWICLRSPRDLRDVQTDAAVRVACEFKAVDDERVACHGGGRRTRSARRDIANDDGKARCPCRADGERVVRDTVQ